MKKLNLFLTTVAFSLLFIPSILAQSKAKANKDTNNWRYEIEAVGVATQGNCLVKVWTYSKKANTAIDQAKKNAVHGLIFKGYAGKQGVPGQLPLANNTNIEFEHADFFKNFFDEGGKYMKFVSVSGDAVASQDVYSVGKEYKVGVIVLVNTALLRKDLEDAGIIRSLNSGF